MDAMSRSAASVLLLDRDTVSSLVNIEECITAVEMAFAAHAHGKSLASQLLHVEAEDGEFHVKAGGLRGERSYFACKIGGGFFGNRKRFDLPNIMGLILLCDGAKGLPLAVMESGVATRLRTGAATAVAAKYLARDDSRAVTICGAGAQSESQLRALRHVLKVERAFIWARSGSIGFAQRMSQELDMEVLPAADLQTASLQSDVIVTCTPARQWFIGRQHVRPGALIAAVGTDSPGKQEIEPELLAAASVVCDLAEQCAHVGDLHHAISAGLMKLRDVRGDLGDVIIGKAPRRLRKDEIIIFDSTGTALQDVAVAALVYRKAVALGKGLPFTLWDQPPKNRASFSTCVCK